MRRLGLLGGMSWESSVEYERLINEAVRGRVGGVASADLLIRSFDFSVVEALQAAGRWDDAGTLLADAARHLVLGGAEGIVICTNTMHRVYDQVAAAVTPVPVLHIADPTAAAIEAAGVRCVGLLGTRFTMEQDFYRGRLTAQHGLTVHIPGAADRETVHRIIYEELCRGEVREDSRAQYRAIMQRLREAGADGIILGCTEIGLLVSPADAPVPLFDTTHLHARSVAEWTLDDLL